MKTFSFSIFFFCFAIGLFAQEDVCRKSTEGTDFWFGFMENMQSRFAHQLEITVTAREKTTFSIAIGPGEIPYKGIFTVEANNSVQIEIPWQQVEATGSEEIQNKGILLTSEKPVNVYALNWNQNSADVAVIYPVSSLGTEYYAMCYYPDIEPIAGNGRNSEFLLVATENGTVVEITPSRVTDQGKPKDSTFKVELNKGQVYQVQSQNVMGSHLEGQGDLTGSHILASKPVAFYSGSLGTRIPSGQCCWDHLFEQIPPVHSWGFEYYLPPLKSRQQDRYRIMASQNQTTVYISGRQPIIIDRGKFIEIPVDHDDAKRVLADKPVMVAQYSQSHNVDREFTGGDGDPFMIILSPVNQSRNEVTFVAYKSPDLNIEDYKGITKHFVNIVTAADEIENILLNGEPIADEFQAFPEGQFSFAQISIEAGTHHIQNINAEGGFSAYAYGFGGLESYGYNVGFNFEITLDLGRSFYFKRDTLLLCHGDSLTLDAGSYFDTYLWNNGETSQIQTVYEVGWYSVKTTTMDGCELEDSVYVHVSHPVTNLGPDEKGCMPYETELSADDGYEKYVWHNEFGDTLSLSQHFMASETGIFSVTVIDQYFCSASDTMELVVYPVPTIDFLGPSQVCGIKTASISVLHSGTADSIWNFEGSFRWESSDPSLIFSDLSYDSASIEAGDWGDYEIYYHLQTIDNCEKTDTFRIRFHPQPFSDFEFESDEKCEGYSQTIKFTGSATDSAAFHWDLNGSHFLDTLGWQNYLISIGAFLPEPPSVSLYINDKGCMSDTVLKLSGAIPNFTMDAGPTRGCDELTVNFSSRLLTEDNVDFMWEFHDGTTSPETALTKTYSAPGFYKVNLTITNPVTQCTNSFAIDNMIKVFPTPTAAISASPDGCYPDTTQLIYIHSIDSSLSYWEFDGMHQVGLGNDTVMVVFDNPTANVKLIVEEFGCVSEPAELQLKRKPRFDFYSVSTEGCHPFSTEIFTEPIDNAIQFEWVTDSVPYPAKNSRLFYASGPGSYDIGLIANSMETGCSDTLIKTSWIEVHPKPNANIRLDYPIAMIENARITFTNRTPDAEYFLWEFDDGNFSQGFHAIHTYSEPGEFQVKLFAETLYGCKDTAAVAVQILPSAVHTPNAFRPDSPIEANRTFMPVTTGIDPFRFNFTVYNRQGQLVFESDSPARPWDGTLQNGQPALMGNYIWIARYFDVQGFEREQKGQVLLIR